MRTNLPDLDEVRRIICSGLRGYRARLYLYGSWAAGTEARASDIDVAILPMDSIPRDLLAELREDLEQSNVIYPVDLVDLSECSEDFRKRVLREGILWSE